MKRVASVFATEHNKHLKSDRDGHNEFNEKLLEEYAMMETQKVRICHLGFLGTWRAKHLFQTLPISL